MRPCKGILAKIGGVLYLFSTGGATFTLTHFPFIQFSSSLCGPHPWGGSVPRAVYIVPSSPCHGFLFTEECALLCSVFIIADGLLFVNTFFRIFLAISSPPRGSVRLPPWGAISCASPCSATWLRLFVLLGVCSPALFFVLTLGGGVAYHLNQYLSVNCKPFSFTL